MPIIKKFGRSTSSLTERTLILGAKRTEEHGSVRKIPEFLTHDAEALLGQWASAMDKVASKPKGRDKPSAFQRSFREDLGSAIWADLTSADGPFARLDEKARDILHKKWDRRIHPYPDGTAAEHKPASPKGRLYSMFAGEVGYGAADKPAIARKIRLHLLGEELRKSGGTRPQGHAVRRANSIEKNTLPKIKATPVPDWDDADIVTYRRHGDVAKAIRVAAEVAEKEKRKVGWRLAAAEIYAHFGKVFTNGGRMLSFAEAEKEHPGLTGLHRAIEDLYRQRLKRHLKDPKLHASQPGTERLVSVILPEDFDSLLRALGNRRQNRDIGALIRKGRILHYEAGARVNRDDVAWINQHWPDDTTKSRYWTSDGQTEIKRHEIFVRIWRSALAHANRTLADWLDPDGKATDIAEGGNTFEQVLAATGQATVVQTANLFGSRAAALESHEAIQDLARLVWTVYTQLRHNSFHFKGVDGFKVALTPKLAEIAPGALQFTTNLLRGDFRDSEARLRAVLRAAQVEGFLDRGRLAEIWAALHPAGEAGLGPALPRFNRIVQRVDGTGAIAELPCAVNQFDMANPAIHCRYVVTKLLYERGFRAWVAMATTDQINAWIKSAEDRTQKAKDEIHGHPEDKARMVGALRLRDGQGIMDFLSELTALTATEFRVQAGYEPNRAAAQEQAEYLFHLQCDVLALAFKEYIRAARLGWLSDTLKPDRVARGVLSDVDKLADPKATPDFEDWQAGIYAVLHLVPVDEVGRLLHQLRRWANGQPADETSVKIERLLELYLDMHDDKFEGGVPLHDHPDLQALFETPDLLAQVLPQVGATEDERRRVPLRGLREMLRFGNLRILKGVFAKAPITTAGVAKLAEYEKSRADGLGGIDHAQQIRQKRHETLAKLRMLGPDSYGDVRDYLFVTKRIIRHRRLANHVRLVNHVRVNQILMSVLGRFADCAGLFERDLYFTLLALIHELGQKPEAVFDAKALGKFEDGQILTALDRNKTPLPASIACELQRHFGLDAKGAGPNRKRRNDFAHFNLLRSKTPINLTAAMNDARALLSHDRKLKNAVSASIVTLLEREQIVAHWNMGTDHQLADAVIGTRRIVHLKSAELAENLRDKRFLTLIAQLFNGRVNNLPDDIAALDRPGIEALAARVTGGGGR